MKHLLRCSLFTIAIAALALGCGKKDEGGEGAAGGEGGGGGGGSETVELAEVGLKAEVPKGAKPGKAIVGEGSMVQGPGVTVTIEPAPDSMPKTADEAEKDATSTYDGVTNVSKETLDDGYILTFENKGGMGTNYWLVGRREIDGKAYKCGVTAPEAAHQKSGVAICKSLAK